MKIQVLVAAMNQEDYSLLDKMNIHSDAIVGNQGTRNEIVKISYKAHEVIYLNFAERGVGLNRNNALMRATGDVCLFADDDMVYMDNYCEIVERAFIENSKADVIVFNLIEGNPHRYVIKKKHRVWFHNYLRYGTARIAIKLQAVRENGIFFNQCFGGGTEHCHGEDNIFLTDCLKAGLRIYAVPMYIATLTEERVSTWNKGFDEKYFVDQGYLCRAITKRWWRLLCLQDAIRHSDLYQRNWYKVYKLMVKEMKNK